MKITITGSLGNISRPLAHILIGAGHDVTIISSNINNKAAIEALGATAAIGSIDDADFLTKAFSGADAVYTMVPPNFTATDYRAYMKNAGLVYAKALQAAGVKHVVNLSSIGAHLNKGNGPVKGLFEVELVFSKLENISITHLRPAFFYTNFYGNVDMIRNAGIIGSNYGADKTVVMVHPADIAEAAAEELLAPATGNKIRYVSSDERTATEIAKILGAAIGKPDLNWVPFTDEQAYEGLRQAGLPEEISRNYVEMGTSVESGILFEDYRKHQLAKPGSRKLEDFAKEFAVVFQS